MRFTGNRYYWQVGGLALAVVLGILSGWVLARWRLSKPAGKGGEGGAIQSEVKGNVKKGQLYGLNDKAFKDQAVGVLAKNDDANTEGTHKLLREGGPSQTVYLMSSALDLDNFAGRKIQVWGETFSSRKVAWLMDVGKVKVLQ